MSEINNNVKSPCIRNCCLGDDDVCLGCFRSLDEIKGWYGADDPHRSIILRSALQRREIYEAYWKAREKWR